MGIYVRRNGAWAVCDAYSPVNGVWSLASEMYGAGQLVWPTPPGVPTLTATPVAYNGGSDRWTSTLTWDATTPGTTSYNLEVSVCGGAWTPVLTETALETYAAVMNGSSTYRYRVRGNNPTGPSDWTSVTLSTGPQAVTGFAQVSEAYASGHRERVFQFTRPKVGAVDGTGCLTAQAPVLRCTQAGQQVGAWTPFTQTANPAVWVSSPVFVDADAGTEQTWSITWTLSNGQYQTASVNTTMLPAPPAQPSSVSGNANSLGTQVTWNWSWAQGGGAAVSSFTIRYRQAGGAWASTSVGSGVRQWVQNTSPGVVAEVEVVAVGTGGESPATSASLTTPNPAPSAPTGVTAIAVTTTSVTWQWSWSQGAGPPASAFQVRSRVNSGGWSAWASVGLSTQWTQSGLPTGALAEVEVVAVGTGGQSASASGSTNTSVPPPNAPSSVSGTWNAGTQQVTWSFVWSQGGGQPATGFQARVRFAGGAWGQWTSVSSPFTQGSVPPGSTVECQVVAVGNGGSSAATTGYCSSPVPPNAPAAVYGTWNNGSVNWSWSWSQGSGQPAQSFVIRVRAAFGAWSGWQNVGYVFSATQAGVSAGGVVAEAEVAAVGTGGTSTATAGSCTSPNPPNPPSNLSGYYSGGSVYWSWGAPAGGGPVSSYSYRTRVAFGAWSGWSSTGGTSVTQGGVAGGGVTADIEVAAVGVGGTSQSVSSSVTSPYPPSAPYGVTSSVSGTTVTFNWQHSGSGITGFVWRTRFNAGAWSAWQNAASNVRSAIITGVPAATNVDFEVAAVGEGGTSGTASGSAATAALPPAAPTGVTATCLAGTVTFQWTWNQGSGSAATAMLFRYRTNSGAWSGYSSFAANTRAAQITSIANGTKVDVEVVAQGTGGNSSAASGTLTTPKLPSSWTFYGFRSSRLRIEWATFSDGVTTAFKFELYDLGWRPENEGGTITVGTKVFHTPHVTGPNGHAYFRVTPVSAAGTGTSTTLANLEQIPSPIWIPATGSNTWRTAGPNGAQWLGQAYNYQGYTTNGYHYGCYFYGDSIANALGGKGWVPNLTKITINIRRFTAGNDGSMTGVYTHPWGTQPATLTTSQVSASGSRVATNRNASFAMDLSTSLGPSLANGSVKGFCVYAPENNNTHWQDHGLHTFDMGLGMKPGGLYIEHDG